MYDPKLANYWAHDAAARTWLKIHREAHRIATEHKDTDVQVPHASGVWLPTEARIQRHPSTRGRPGRKATSDFGSKNSVDGGRKHFVGESSNASIDSSDTRSETLVQDDEIELNEEMAAFFRQTIEHRKQRDADREREAKAESEFSDEYIMADKIGVEGIRQRTFATPDAPSQFRAQIEEKRRLFGAEADKIIAMETHLQQRFEVQLSRSKAQLWPNIPLKF